MPAHPAQRFLCLAEEPTEHAGPGRCSTDRVDPASLERQRQGLWLPPNRVARLTRLAGIKAQVGYKRRPGNYSGKPSLAVDNTLDRQFDVAAPDRAWVTDITYIRTLEGFTYLAVVIDLYSRRVVG